MSLEGYIVGKVENPFLWEEGDHLAEIVYVGTKEGKYGKYFSVEWFDEKEKNSLFEAFDIWSGDERIKAWQKSELNKFLHSVGLKEGDPYNESKVFGKKCHLTIKTYKNKNTGAEKSIVSKRVPFVNDMHQVIVENVQQSVSQTQHVPESDLNDDIPF